MPLPENERHAQLCSHLRQTALLNSCSAVLQWDEQTYMPPGGAELRADQVGLLSGLIHDAATSPQLKDLLADLAGSSLVAEADSPSAVNIREALRDFELASRLPRELVQQLSRVSIFAQQAWVEARRESRFDKFLPWLKQMVALKREEAQALDCATGVAYDALLDQHEPGMTSAELTRLFAPLRDELVKLAAAITASGVKPRADILAREYPVEAQKEFSRMAARDIGFDFERGRLDEAAHPFCSGLGPGDTRLTTRYNPRHFSSAFFGTLHESGHGIYDQGLDTAAFGLPMGSAVSLGIHESQSRLWENFVGRGRSFWAHFFPRARSAFPAALGDVSLDDFHAAINDVRASCIRVEADEVTYNLHILLRFEIERPLIAGDLEAADVPAYWNERFKAFLGFAPPDDARGCLQDIHWSAGLMGYFPTYTLGNIYAAQLCEAARRDLGDLDEQFARGDFTPLREWLRTNIHRRGKQYRSAALISRITGSPPSHAPLMRHLWSKYGPLYGL